MSDLSDIFSLFAPLLLVAFVVVSWRAVSAGKKAIFAGIAAGSRDQCQLCRATGLKFQNETAGDYRCLACGFDTDLRQREDLAGYLEALRLLDAARDKLDEAREIARIQDLDVKFFEVVDGPATKKNLNDAQNNLTDGLAELKQLVQDFAEIADNTTLPNGETISTQVYAHLGRPDDDGKRPEPSETRLDYRVIKYDAEKAVAVCDRVRPALARPVEQAVEPIVQPE